MSSGSLSSASSHCRVLRIFCFLVLCFLLHSGWALALPQAYLDAVEDAKDPRADEIAWLTAITDPLSQGFSRTRNGKQEVKVVTWTGNNFFDGSVGQEYTLPNGVTVWVTLAPKLQEFYIKNRLSHDNLPLRIEQLLGLPPDSDKDRFVEIWARVEDLFRPSKDAEVDDNYAQLTFPPGTTAAHKAWFNALVATSYTSNPPYPWTQLGYTYDWGTDAFPHKGLSEYVISGGSTFIVAAIYGNEEYFPEQVAMESWWAVTLLALLLAGGGSVLLLRRRC